MSDGENIEEAVTEAVDKREDKVDNPLLSESHPDVSDEIAFLNKKVTGVKVLSDVEETTIVPTIFPGFNRATRIGGFPASVMLVPVCGGPHRVG